MKHDRTLRVGARAHGFVVKTVAPVRELRLTACRLEHIRSGARLLHMCADDAENLFSISFPTPPPDDTGVPHILEHAALSGSRKFPVRDPFFEMLKMSMATFLNAMTDADCTYYPVASNVKQDLFNLAEVYFDAVFHPLLSEQTFRREGYHLAPLDKETPKAGVTINGIVYNEMKGAFSNPESRLYHCATRGLFPDTIYGRVSGGDPAKIPDLTYNGFKGFHDAYYHPSNAYFLVYGDIPTLEYLRFLEPKLDQFERRDIRPVFTRQSKWNSPREMADSYPIGTEELQSNRTYVKLIWLVGDALDPANVVDLEILSQILMGHEAAPLRKAVIDSKLGRDLIASGYASIGVEAVFALTLKGTEPDRAGAFVELVVKTLAEIADGEIDGEKVASAFQQAAYDHLEVLPLFPLHIMDWTLDAWIYGADPLTFLRMGKHLRDCKKRYKANPALFNDLIRERLLNNRHRLTVVLKPDREWQARTERDFARRMERIRAGLTDKKLEQIAEDARELELAAGEPNPPEALAKLPQLKIGDLPPHPEHIPTVVERLSGGVDFLCNDVFANGVNYLHMDFNLTGFPADLWRYLPRYADAIGKLGADGMNYEVIARRTAAATGGIYCSAYFNTHVSDANRPVWGLRISLKALDNRIKPALNLLGSLIFGLDPRDNNRLRDVLVQAQAQYHTQLVHDGVTTASHHAGRGHTPEAYLAEITTGLPQLRLTDRMVSDFDKSGAELMDKIEAIRDFLPARERLTVSFTGSNRAGETIRKTLVEWIGRMRSEPLRPVPTGFTPYQYLPREGLAGPIQVAHCCRVFPAPHYSHPDEPLLTLGARLARLDYVLNEIRFKGNAYGAWCRYNSLGGTMELGSFSDPNIAGTLAVFSGLTDYVRNTDWTQTDIERAIIATAKTDEQPIRPGYATSMALHRHLIGQTPELREQRYVRLLAATAREVKRALLDHLDANFARSAVCVVADRAKLEEANRQMPDLKLNIEDIVK